MSLAILAGDVFDIGDAESQSHALGGTESIDEHRDLFADDVLEEQRRTAVFHYAIGDLGDFQFGFDPMGNAPELALAL